MMRMLLILFALISITGCVNEYKTNYKAANGATPEIINALRVNPAPLTPMVERAPKLDANSLLALYTKRGYLLIGTSFFNTTNGSTDSAAAEAGKEQGADLVAIFDPQYTGSTTSQVPITTPTTTTSFTNSNATAYGTGGVVNAYGTATTTTYGSQTTYVPITVNHVSYGALYFIKARHPLGVIPRDLNDAERKQYQTNKGVVVSLVIDDSPAYMNDVLVDDIITEINGAKILNQNNFYQAVFSNSNKLTKVSILRNGTNIEKQIQFAR